MVRKKTSERKNLGIVLTNREMFGYFRGGNIVKPTNFDMSLRIIVGP